jgi:monofunctional biosynthetic peptidoglycan transglycosylase
MNHQLSAEQLSWRVVTDAVMGGVSKSQMQDNTEEGHTLFTGTVSTDNNGGFASTQFDLPAEMREGVKKITIRVKGDGKRYSMRLRPTGAFSQVSYRAYFETKADEWQEFTFELSEFTPTFRGRVLEDVPPIAGQPLQVVGILIADEQTGEFNLLIDWVQLKG